MIHKIQGMNFKKGTQFMVIDHSNDYEMHDNITYTFHDIDVNGKMIISNDFEDKIYSSHKISLLQYHKIELKLV